MNEKIFRKMFGREGGNVKLNELGYASPDWKSGLGNEFLTVMQYLKKIKSP